METVVYYQPAFALLHSALVAFIAFRQKCVDKCAAFLLFMFMTVHMAFGYRFGALFLLYILTSSKAIKIYRKEHCKCQQTKKRQTKEKKRCHVPIFRRGRQHNWKEILAFNGIPTVFVVTLWKIAGWEDNCLDSRKSILVTSLIGALLGHYASCCGNRWSTDVGLLGHTLPRLITTFKQVEMGTNGGVTKAGFAAAMVAGSNIGVAFVFLGFLSARCTFDVAMMQLWVIPLCALTGLCGSLIDSLLGATLQYSGYCCIRKKVVGRPTPTVKKISGRDILNNDTVTYLSILLTTVLTVIVFLYIF